MLVSRNRPLIEASPDRGALEAAAARCARAHPCMHPGRRRERQSGGMPGVGIISFLGRDFFLENIENRTGGGHDVRGAEPVFMLDVPK